jgi:hypothetical protein
MIDRATFERIRRKHGSYASWAVWSEPSERPKSNIGDLTVLDPARNPNLLQILKDDVVMVGLNMSRLSVEELPFRNFHDGSSNGQDFKIRFAFAGTAFYGAYMTDVVKFIPIVDSASLTRHLADQPGVVDENVGRLLEELHDLGARMPTILAFGRATHQFVVKHVPSNAYGRLVRLTHYSHRMSKEEYREEVHGQLRIA